MASIQISKWSDEQYGPLCEEAVRRLHVPASRHRISRYTYRPDENISGSSRSGRIYVLAGRCRITVAGEMVCLEAGDVADLPSGEFSLEVAGQDDGALSLLRVWELPIYGG